MKLAVLAAAMTVVLSSSFSMAQSIADRQQALVARWHDLNGACRGTSDPTINEKACRERAAVSAQLESMNFCHGHRGDLGYQMKWHQCDDNSMRVSPPSQPQVQPKNIPVQSGQSLPGPASGGWFVLIGNFNSTSTDSCAALVVPSSKANDPPFPGTKEPFVVISRHGPFPSEMEAEQALKRAGWIGSYDFFLMLSACPK